MNGNARHHRSTTGLQAAIRGGLLTVLLAIAACGAWGQEKMPPDREARVKSLIQNTADNYQENLTCVRDFPDASFEIVRDNWKSDVSPTSRQVLMSLFVLTANPHLLEVLHLGATDPDVSVRYSAYEQLVSFAFRIFHGDEAGYQAWHKATAGKPVADVVRAEARAFAARLGVLPDNQQNAAQQVLLRLDLTGSSPLVKLRREELLDGKILDVLGRWIKPGEPNSSTALYVVRSLKPDEAYIRRVVVPLTSKENPAYIRAVALSIVASIPARWSSELLLVMLVEEYPGQDSWMVMQAITSSKDPHLIPALIVLLDAEDSSQTPRSLEAALLRLTGLPPGQPHDGGWWRLWWSRNRQQFPEDVRSMPFPKLKLKPAGETSFVGIRRKLEWRQIGDDPQRAYWLLTPAWIPPQAGDGKPTTQHPTFGLLVVLSGGNGGGEAEAQFWHEVGTKALKEGYLVAVPVAPKWQGNQTTAWLTQQNHRLVPAAKFTTEAFLNDVVRDVRAHYTVDPARVWLHGVAEGGMAAYACSLSDTTPFKGFYILASGFKSTQLPALSHAKGRRYLIQHSKDDKTSPYWQASAAENLLRQQGANIKLLTYAGDHGYKFTGSASDTIREALTWLEAGK